MRCWPICNCLPTSNDREKAIWKYAEAKLGFERHRRTNINIWWMTSSVCIAIGIQAAHNWYYTISAEFKRRFCNGYKANSELVCILCSCRFSDQCRYGPNWRRRNSTSLCSRRWHNLRHVGNSEVNETKFGPVTDETKSSKNDFGSRRTAYFNTEYYSFHLVWFAFELSDQLQNGYVSSGKIQWILLNRYLSTKLYVYMHYDDSSKPAEGKYFQVKELLSFGINYQW